MTHARIRPATILALVGVFALACLNLALSSVGYAQQQTHSANPAQPSDVSPVLGIERERLRLIAEPAGEGIPSIDGSGNNLANPLSNAAGQALRRRFAPDYGDGVAVMAGEQRPSARMVSNGVHAQAESRLNKAHASDFLWQWGQFIDHDLDLTDGVDPAEAAPINVPMGDPWFDPNSSGSAQIALNRSLYDHATGTASGNPRQQVNEISGWLDASMVYGSDPIRAAALRTFSDGKLATSEGDLLPFNTAGLANAGGSGANLFLAGDVRANEQVGLIAIHTLFVREHNWWAGQIAELTRGLSDEEIYQRARNMVSAEIQSITFREFLPLLLGRKALPRYDGYKATVDARISNHFSSAAYRLGHSLLSPQLQRLGADGQAIAAGHLALRDAFFSPQRLIDTGIEPILRGLAVQRCQELDVFIIDDVRNFLFGAPGSGGFDLAALNIQRGRDHGLPAYNQVRIALGMGAITHFEQISADPEVVIRMQSVYDRPDHVDLWSGLLAERHVGGAMVGSTLRRLLSDQFLALRDGDRFWYQNRLSPAQIAEVDRTRLSDIIRRNSSIGRELPNNVFQINSSRG